MAASLTRSSASNTSSVAGRQSTLGWIDAGDGRELGRYGAAVSEAGRVGGVGGVEDGAALGADLGGGAECTEAGV